jgi:RimJ/RimL family protein N-acetyltransferase
MIEPLKTSLPRADPRPSDSPWPALRWPPPEDTVLSGRIVDVRPADADRDAGELFAALDDAELWHHVRGRPVDVAALAELIRTRRAAGWVPWVVRLRAPYRGRPAGAVIGTSSYLEVAPDDARLEIGATTYVRDVWGSLVNPDTKLALLAYAFEGLGAGRVQLKTDVRNHRSQLAIARLGAQYEGTLRRYQRRFDDTVRDTVLFSITADEWPAIRTGLDERIDRDS